MTTRFAAFQYDSYRLYFFSRFFAAIAAQVVATAVAWQLYDETGSKFLLGLIGLVQFLPALCFVLITGLASDRYGRRLIMSISMFVQMTCAAIFLGLALIGQIKPVWFLAVLTIMGTSRAFFRPASQSIVSNIVPPDMLPNAVALNSSSWQAAMIIGPAIGGFLCEVSPGAPYVVSVLSYLVAGILIFAIPKPAQRRSVDPVNLKILFGGFSYIYDNKIVLGAISMDLFAVLLGGANALLPVYAKDILGIGAEGNGLLRTAFAVGGTITVIAMAAVRIREKAGLIMFLCVGLFGLGTAIFGLSTLPWLSMLMLAIVGAADTISMIVRGSIIQLWTPDELRGRVNAVNGIFISASNELGEMRAGFMAALIGAVPAVTLGGIAAVGVTGLWAFMFPALRKIQTLDIPEELKEKAS